MDAGITATCGIAMVRGYCGRDPTRAQIRGRAFMAAAACLLLVLPLLAACSVAPGPAGPQRQPDHPVVTGPSAGTPHSTSRPVTHSAAEPADRTLISGIQENLADLGYHPGPVDGIFGPRTMAAVRHFQADAKLQVDGTISTELSAALRKQLQLHHDAAAASEPDKAVATAASSTARTVGHSSRKVERTRNSAVQQPYYEVGDSYTYSNGRTETVIRIEGKLVYWAVSDGSHLTALSNFVLPPVRLENAGDSVEFSVTSDAKTKWPPAMARQLSYHVETVGGEGGRLREAWSGEWRCAVGGQSALAVPAGLFDVISISCERSRGSGNTNRRIVWDYAPDVRHFVRRTESTGGTGTSDVLELVAVRPGKSGWSRSARSGFRWAIRKLLDRGAVGDSVDWRVGGVGVEFDITLTGDVEAAEGVSCRRYTMLRRKPAVPRLFPALACRNGADGQWKIPGLENGSVLPENILAVR